jgi:hypothetical protein
MHLVHEKLNTAFSYKGNFNLDVCQQVSWQGTLTRTLNISLTSFHCINFIMQLSVQMTYFITTYSSHTYPCSEQTKGFSPVCSR